MHHTYCCLHCRPPPPPIPHPPTPSPPSSNFIVSLYMSFCFLFCIWLKIHHFEQCPTPPNDSWWRGVWWRGDLQLSTWLCASATRALVNAPVTAVVPGSPTTPTLFVKKVRRKIKQKVWEKGEENRADETSRETETLTAHPTTQKAKHRNEERKNVKQS